MTLDRPAGECQGDRAGGPVPYWSDDRVALHVGDCLDVMRQMPDACVDSVVTDPPSGISFMGREWDGSRGGRDRWIAWLAERMAEACRVLKPGGHALVWSLPRTSGWTQMALEDAGFEVRDCIVHIFGSGYPKSLDVSKAIDKRGGRPDLAPQIGSAIRLAREQRSWTTGQADSHFCGGSTNWSWFEGRKGIFRSPTPEVFARIVAEWPELEPWAAAVAEAEREVIGEGYRVRRDSTVQIVGLSDGTFDLTAPATTTAACWQGWGTALKPGQEMWWLVRKPIAGTVAATVLEHGTGALNIAACRVGSGERTNNAGGSSSLQRVSRVESGYRPTVTASEGAASEVAGRWPANVVFTHSAGCLTGDEDQVDWCEPDCPVAELNRQSGVLQSGANPSRRGSDKFRDAYGDFAGQQECTVHRGADSGGASRFFHAFRYQAKAPSSERPRGDDGSAHVTVKSLGLMKFLVTLVTPPGGTVLDPFCGSGASGEAAVIEGFRCVLIDEDPKSVRLTRVRLSKPIQPTLMGFSA